MVKILGIDPGSRTTGYGVITQHDGTLSYVASGCIKTGDVDLASKLRILYNSINQVINLYNPQVVAIERVFMAHNVDSALKLGQARGALIVSCSISNLEVFEYTARQIKQALVGVGSANKKQVQSMVMQILRLSSAPQLDASDALACAICHANFYATLLRHDLHSAKKRRGRLRL